MKIFLKAVAGLLSAVILFSAAAIVPVSAAKLNKPSFRLLNTKKGVKISWKHVKGASKYTVLRKLKNAKKYRAIKTLKLHTYIDAKAASGKKYTYTVVAKGSGKKAQAKGKSILRLNTPENLKAEFSDDGENAWEIGAYAAVKLSWNKVKGASRYEIQRVTITNGSVGLYKSLGYSNSNSYTFYETRSGSWYRYKIRAIKGKYKSAFTAPSDKKGFLQAPYIQLEVLKSSYDAVRISWYECEGAKGYRLYKSSDNGKSYTLLKASESFEQEDFDLFYDDKDVKAGEKYFYYVQAYNNDMTSQSSNTPSIVFKDYDIAVQSGKSKKDDYLSSLYNYDAVVSEGHGTEFDGELKSDDENIAEIYAEKTPNGLYDVKVKGKSAGYTYVRFIANSEEKVKLRVKVTDEPVYDITLKKGETERIEEFYGEDGALNFYEDSELEVNVTSDNTDVLKVNNPTSKDFTLTGVNSGEAEVKVKIRLIIEDLNIVLYDKAYSVLVTE